jgi:signal transduction histidine kinase
MGTVGNRRTWLALALVALAVLFPCAAWYLVGSREVAHQIRDLTANANVNATQTAHRIAQQLSARLNALREAEAKRPFYHYQTYFHDPEGAAEGAAVVPSPLGAGARDPLIELYFHVDAASGTVNLPGAAAELKQYEQLQQRRERADDQLFLQRQLERGLNSVTLNFQGESKQPGQRVEKLAGDAWAQNVEAADIYRNIRSQSAPPRANPPTPAADAVEIYVGPLKWRTVYVANQPALVALREVTTPAGAFFQGFLVSTTGLDNYFKTAGMPARLLPGAPTGPLEAPLAIAVEPWRIVVDARSAIAFAQRQAAELRRSFWLIFAGGVAVAGLAGLGVVWIVWQTERLARQRSQFAASAAHELRTPLAGLRLHADMLAENLGDPTKTRDYARRVSDESDRLGRVVSNVLGFSRLERGRLTVQPVPGNLADHVRACVANHQPALEAAGIRLEINIADNLPPVRFDRDAISLILQNLLDNAEKHTRCAADRTVQVTLRPTPAGIELQVTDHGPGLPAAVCRHLFEPFRRGDTADAPAGLGLGLCLVKALAEAQGATIRYAAPPPAPAPHAEPGATFILTLQRSTNSV